MLTVQNPRRLRQPPRHGPIKENINVTLKLLDSIKYLFNSKINYDANLFMIQKDSLQFKINKEYTLIRYNYLKHMDSLFTNPAMVRSTLRSSKENYCVNLDSNKIAVVFIMDSAKAYKQKNIVIEKKKEISRLLNKSSFLEDIFLYPVYLASDIWDKYQEH